MSRTAPGSVALATSAIHATGGMDVQDHTTTSTAFSGMPSRTTGPGALFVKIWKAWRHRHLAVVAMIACSSSLKTALLHGTRAVMQLWLPSARGACTWTAEASNIWDLASFQAFLTSLNNNQISTLPEDVFRDLASLYVLYLFNNKILTIPAGVFQNLKEL